MGFETKDSGTRVKFDSGFTRDSNKGKPRYDLLPLGMLTRWAELMARGAEKYGDNNWKLAKTDIEKNRFRESAFRHFIQWMSGDQDEDHASAIMFNVAAWETLKASPTPAETTNTTQGSTNNLTKEMGDVTFNAKEVVDLFGIPHLKDKELYKNLSSVCPWWVVSF